MIGDTKRRLAVLEQQVWDLRTILEPAPPGTLQWQLRVETAADRGTVCLVPGVRVRYCHRDSGIPTWSGVVIDRPLDCRKFGAQGDPLIWVVTDAGFVRGCYPWNLQILPTPTSCCGRDRRKKG